MAKPRPRALTYDFYSHLAGLAKPETMRGKCIRRRLETMRPQFHLKNFLTGGMGRKTFSYGPPAFAFVFPAFSSFRSHWRTEPIWSDRRYRFERSLQLSDQCQDGRRSLRDAALAVLGLTQNIPTAKPDMTLASIMIARPLHLIYAMLYISSIQLSRLFFVESDCLT